MYYIIGKIKEGGIPTDDYEYDNVLNRDKQKVVDTALNKSEAERLVKKHQKELGDKWVVRYRRAGGMQV